MGRSGGGTARRGAAARTGRGPGRHDIDGERVEADQRRRALRPARVDVAARGFVQRQRDLQRRGDADRPVGSGGERRQRVQRLQVVHDGADGRQPEPVDPGDRVGMAGTAT